MADRTCSIDGCTNRVVARGWCSRHYAKWRRHGDPTHRTSRDLSEDERFWAKVDVGHPLGCWVWTAGRDWDGYGIFKGQGRVSCRAHRWTYARLRGPIADGLSIDHLCRNTSCVNPDHLEPVDTRTNIHRGFGLAAKNAAKTHCPRGHQLPDDRTCRTCAAIATRIYKGWDATTAEQVPVRQRDADADACVNGHAFDDENTYREKGNGARHCRTCHRDRQRKRYHERKRREASL